MKTKKSLASKRSVELINSKDMIDIIDFRLKTNIIYVKLYLNYLEKEYKLKEIYFIARKEGEETRCTIKCNKHNHEAINYFKDRCPVMIEEAVVDIKDRFISSVNLSIEYFQDHQSVAVAIIDITMPESFEPILPYHDINTSMSIFFRRFYYKKFRTILPNIPDTCMNKSSIDKRDGSLIYEIFLQICKDHPFYTYMKLGYISPVCDDISAELNDYFSEFIGEQMLLYDKLNKNEHKKEKQRVQLEACNLILEDPRSAKIINDYNKKRKAKRDKYLKKYIKTAQERIRKYIKKSKKKKN